MAPDGAALLEPRSRFTHVPIPNEAVGVVGDVGRCIDWLGASIMDAMARLLAKFRKPQAA